MSERIDLGHEHSYTKIVDVDGNWVGINQWHINPTTGEECVGFVPFDTTAAHLVTLDSTPHWDLISTEPFHLEPSLLCRGCGDHGYVRAGRWEPC